MKTVKFTRREYKNVGLVHLGERDDHYKCFKTALALKLTNNYILILQLIQPQSIGILSEGSIVSSFWLMAFE